MKSKFSWLTLAGLALLGAFMLFRSDAPIAQAAPVCRWWTPTGYWSIAALAWTRILATGTVGDAAYRDGDDHG